MQPAACLARCGPAPYSLLWCAGRQQTSAVMAGAGLVCRTSKVTVPKSESCTERRRGQPATATEHQAHSRPGSAAAPATHAPLLTPALECCSPCRAGHTHTSSPSQWRGPAASWSASGSQPSLRASLYIPAGHYTPSLYYVYSDAFTATTHMHSDNDRSARAAVLLQSSLCYCCVLSEAG